MKEITKIMVNDFKIMKLGMDFMGYHVNRKQDLSYHHLIIPRRHCKEAGLGEGYLYWNGAILRQNTSHDYLHIIENIKKEIEIMKNLDNNDHIISTYKSNIS